MREITLGSKHRVKIYDSIDEMTVARYHRWNQMMVLNEGVGLTVEGLSGRLANVANLIDAERPDAAKVELHNIAVALSVTRAGADMQTRALAATVAEIDGEPTDDLTSDGLDKTVERLQGIITKGERDGILDSVKKKIDEELAFYYPEVAGGESEQTALLRNIADALLEEVQTGCDNSERIARLRRMVVEAMEVVDYASYERESDVAFEQMCLSIRETMHVDTKGLTVMEYYAARKSLDDRAKEYEKITNKNKHRNA